MFRVLIFVFLSTFSFAITADDMFLNLKSFFSKNMPDTFICEIKGENLSKSVREIPADAVRDKKNLRVELLFHKKWGSKVVLRGVVPAYEDRFSYIERVFEYIIPFLKEKTFADFSKRYDLYDVKDFGFKLKKKLTYENYLDIYIKEGLIAQIKEFKNNKLLMNMNIFYKYQGKYFLPAELKVFFYEEDKLKILKFELTNFDFNPKMTEEEFLG